MENFLTVAGQVGVLFALMGAGAVCRRAKLIDDASVKGMVNVLLLVVTPCLMVDVFQRPFDSSMLKSLGFAFAVALAAHAFMIAVASLALKKVRADTRTVLKVATVFSNAGFNARRPQHSPGDDSDRLLSRRGETLGGGDFARRPS